MYNTRYFCFLFYVVFLPRTAWIDKKKKKKKANSLELVSDSYPVVAKVVFATKDLQVTTVGHKLLDELVQFLGLLTLSTAF